MRALLVIASLLITSDLALAQSSDPGNALISGLNASLGTGGMASGRIIQMIAVLTVLSLAPSLLVMMTSFTRIAVALSFLRSGIGLQSTPANIILISLALFMTLHIMTPTFDKAWQNGVQPLMDNKITERDAFDKIVDPFRDFMAMHVREKDLNLLHSLTKNTSGPLSDKPDLRILIPAFMMSELRRGFEIGFLIALPFLVIDMIVATLTMSMGMMMLPPSVIALPVKVLFFVLIDGWSLLVGSLIRSYG